jgi:hypothetical protein
MKNEMKIPARERKGREDAFFADGSVREGFATRPAGIGITGFVRR